jgi:hypothetical protein
MMNQGKGNIFIPESQPIMHCQKMSFICLIHTWHAFFSSYPEQGNHICNLHLCLLFAPAEKNGLLMHITAEFGEEIPNWKCMIQNKTQE